MQIDVICGLTFYEIHSGDDEEFKKGQYRSLDDGWRLQDNSKNNSKYRQDYLKIEKNGRVNLPFFLDILSFWNSCRGFPGILCLTLTYPYTNTTFMLSCWSPKILCLEHDVNILRRAFILLPDRTFEKRCFVNFKQESCYDTAE